MRLNPGDRVISQLVIKQADRLGDQPLLSTGYADRSYASMCDKAARLAGALASNGIRRGDRVAIMASNRVEMLDMFLACCWLGAIFVPINTASRGIQLEHVLSDSGPRALAIEADLLMHLDAITNAPAELERIWVFDDLDQANWRHVSIEPLPCGADPIGAAPTQPGDTVAVLYTSGTTGPPKGVCCPNAQFYWWGVNTGSALGIERGDVLYTCLPLFHTNALNSFIQALCNEACFVLGPRFSASQFWERACDAEATVTYLLGAMVSILLAQAETPFDRAHRVHRALAPGAPARLHDTFTERFGVQIIEGHGMTETNLVIGPRDGIQRAGSMGRVMPGFDARVVDEHDAEVLDGVSGELVMRSDEPFAFGTGYWQLPQETVTAWRNLWFHSGDRVVRDGDGYFTFLDRLKDTIRRRGENISAWEVEQVLHTHPAVDAAAVVAVPSSLGEDDVLACIVPRDGVTVDPVDLIRFCEPRLAYFAIPRYVDVLDQLPLTENGKVRKALLRERGLTATTWDRETAGVKLRRS